MKILSFGHIPSAVGGRQSSGLANVIYQLALSCGKAGWRGDDNGSYGCLCAGGFTRVRSPSWDGRKGC